MTGAGLAGLLAGLLVLLVKPGWAKNEVGPGYKLISPVSNLSCHQCFLNSQGENCLSMADVSRLRVQRCGVDEFFCVVEKHIEDGQLVSFSRRCAKVCSTACRAAGSSYRVEKCHECCDRDMCNSAAITASAATRPAAPALVLAALAAAAAAADRS